MIVKENHPLNGRHSWRNGEGFRRLPIGVVVSDKCLSRGSVELKYANVKGDYPTNIAQQDICSSVERFIENQGIRHI